MVVSVLGAEFNEERAGPADGRCLMAQRGQPCVGMLSHGRTLCRKRGQVALCGRPPYLSLSDVNNLLAQNSWAALVSIVIAEPMLGFLLNDNISALYV